MPLNQRIQSEVFIKEVQKKPRRREGENPHLDTILKTRKEIVKAPERNSSPEKEKELLVKSIVLTKKEGRTKQERGEGKKGGEGKERSGGERDRKKKGMKENP